LYDPGCGRKAQHSAAIIGMLSWQRSYAIRVLVDMGAQERWLLKILHDKILSIFKSNIAA